jgi:nitroreductase
MSFLELAMRRYSVREYKPDAVEEEKLRQVLAAALLAPTAANRQAFRLLVIHTRGREDELRKIYNQPWFVQAPLLIAIAGLPKRNWKRSDGQNYVYLDSGIVMDHLILAAAELGLGTCWVGAFDPEAARKVLQLPPEAEPIAFTPLGYPADQPRAKVRKTVEELVHYERWPAKA